jgi:hypothetical protein
MSYLSIDNPGDGHCGFYAFAIGLLHLIIHQGDENRGIYNKWVGLDPNVQPSLDAFLEVFKQVGIEVLSEDVKRQLTEKLSEALRSNFLPIFRKIGIYRVLLRFGLNNSVGQDFIDRLTLENLSASVDALNNLEARFAYVCGKDDYVGIKPLKDSIKLILKDHRLKELSDLLSHPSRIISADKSKLYQDFAELVEKTSFSLLPNNVLASSQILRQVALSIQERILREPHLVLKDEKKKLLIMQAFETHQDEITSIISQKYAPKNPWWASSEDLIDLASCFDENFNIIQPQILIRESFPCIYLENISNVHWKTRVYFSGHEPLAFEEKQAPRARLIKETQEKITYYNALGEAVTGRYRALKESLLTSYRETFLDENEIAALKLRIECHCSYLNLLSAPYSGDSLAFQIYSSALLEYHRQQAELEQTSSDIEALKTALLENQDHLNQLKTQFYQDLKQELAIIQDQRPETPRLDSARPGRFFPSPPHRTPLPKPKKSVSPYLYGSAAGIGLGALVLNAIPGVLPAVMTATGMGIVAANISFILLGLYLANLLSLIYQIYRESRAQITYSVS